MKNSDVLALLSEASCTYGQCVYDRAMKHFQPLVFLCQVGELSSVLSGAAIARSSYAAHSDSAAAGPLMSDTACRWSASWEATDPPYARIVDTTSEGTHAILKSCSTM